MGGWAESGVTVCDETNRKAPGGTTAPVAGGRNGGCGMGGCGEGASEEREAGHTKRPDVAAAIRRAVASMWGWHVRQASPVWDWEGGVGLKDLSKE